MADGAKIELSPGMEGRFHAIGRARIRSRASLSVEYSDQGAMLELDFGLGEPNSEQQVLKVVETGTFELPEIVMPHELVSVRTRQLPVGTVTILVQFEPVG